MEILPFIQQEWKKLLSRENAVGRVLRARKNGKTVIEGGRGARREGGPRLQPSDYFLSVDRGTGLRRSSKAVRERGGATCAEFSKLRRLYSSFVIAIIRESASCYARVNE